MREIKFRTWTGKKMHYGNSSIADKTDWPLMQFTGLKDREGKEIWEGDIIRWHHYTLHDILAKVEWHNGSFKQFPIQNKGANCGDITNLSGKLEVLGNIYENGDLLK